jgi:hypothetical protein
MAIKSTESSASTPTTGTKFPDYSTGLITQTPTPSPVPISSPFNTPIEDSNSAFDPITDEEYQQMEEEDGPLPPVENNTKERGIRKRPYQVPDSFVARRSGRDHKVTEGQYKEIASYGIDGSAKPGAKKVVQQDQVASTADNTLAIAVYQPDVPIPPSPHVIDTAFFLVNIPNQPTRGAAPYLPKNYWDAIKQPDYKEQWHPALSAQVKSLEDNDGNPSNFLLVKSL